jgi:catechol 2,3-dioxygenase-like lactoylglutathione lyase family enzyme
MRPRIAVITLGVDDLGRALQFYRDGLGLPPAGEDTDRDTVTLALLEGVRLALRPRERLALDAGLWPGGPAGPPRPPAVALTRAVASRAGVDGVIADAFMAGATVTQPARTTRWGGYAGYVRDPDGHLWEIRWDPQRPSEADPEGRPPRR